MNEGAKELDYYMKEIFIALKSVLSNLNDGNARDHFLGLVDKAIAVGEKIEKGMNPQGNCIFEISHFGITYHHHHLIFVVSAPAPEKPRASIRPTITTPNLRSPTAKTLVQAVLNADAREATSAIKSLCKDSYDLLSSCNNYPSLSSIGNQFKELVPKLINMFKEYLSTQSEASLSNFVKLVQEIDNKSFEIAEQLKKAQEKEQQQNMEQIAKGTTEATVSDSIWLKIIYESDVKVMKIPRKINFVDFINQIKQKFDVTLVTTICVFRL